MEILKSATASPPKARRGRRACSGNPKGAGRRLARPFALTSNRDGRRKAHDTFTGQGDHREGTAAIAATLLSRRCRTVERFAPAAILLDLSCKIFGAGTGRQGVMNSQLRIQGDILKA